jgi:hypothetical protein
LAGELIPKAFTFSALKLESAQSQGSLPTPPATVISVNDALKIAELNNTQKEHYLREIRNFDAICASNIH